MTIKMLPGKKKRPGEGGKEGGLGEHAAGAQVLLRSFAELK
jgi:hypothetical protein